MDFIPELDASLSAKDRVALLKEARQEVFGAGVEDEHEVRLSDRDVALLRNYAADEDASVRKAAVAVWAWHGAVTWEDAERWMLDPDEDVRREAAFTSEDEWSTLGRLCQSDRARYVQIIAASARLYNSMSVAALLLCEEDPAWVDHFWPMLGELLDLGRRELNSNIICGDLEDLLVYGLIALDDPRLQSWVTGNSIERKMALLSVVRWFGMREPWQQRLANALAHDKVKVVARTAKDLLARKVVPDIQTRWWAGEAGTMRGGQQG